jgi:hypothetical protein
MSRLERFWLAPADPLPLALVRIALGLVMCAWTVSLLGQMAPFFAPAGIAGGVAAHRAWYAWTLLGTTPSPLRLGAVVMALAVGSAALVAGWHSRVAGLTLFLALASLQRTDPYVFNSGDTLLRVLCLYVAVAPSGAALSLDARRRGRRTIEAWGIRLIQLQVSLVYAAAVWSKLHGAAWRDGTAVAYAVRLPDLVRFSLGAPLAHSLLLAHVATYGTLALEAALAVLVWPRRTRRFVLIAGCAFHVAIDASLRVGFFSAAVLVGYLAFLDAAWARRLPARLAATGARLRARTTRQAVRT